LIAATNHTELLDQVMFQRLDDLVEYDLPEKKEIDAALKNWLHLKHPEFYGLKRG
jgi:AAA+ superfamily predicted ATPase